MENKGAEYINMPIKKLLIVLLFFYGFYSNVISTLTGFDNLKLIISALFVSLFLFDFYLNSKDYKQKKFLLLPVILIPVYIAVQHQVDQINFFYTILFGWMLAQDSKFTLKIIKITFLIQFVLLVYEFSTKTFVFSYLQSGGLISDHVYDYKKAMELFLTSGFRPKGLFIGTLVATSFVIYLSMIFRNNLKVLAFIFIMAVMLNGRLALIVVIATIGLKFLKKYDIVLYYNQIKKRFSFRLKLIFTIMLLTVVLGVLLLLLPPLETRHILNAFNLKSTSNAGRIYYYIETFNVYTHYKWVELLFGSNNYSIFDIYGRIGTTESGFLSMLLNIGLIGVIIYLYFFYKAWRTDKKPLFDLKNKEIGYRYVVFITFVSFLQYNHIGGNVRGMLFWFIIIDQILNVQVKKFSCEIV